MSFPSHPESTGPSVVALSPRRIDPYRLRRRMVEQIRASGVQDADVLEAMGRVPRHLFVDEALSMRAYECTNLPLGLGQTISNPLTVARMTELLEVRPGMRVLEVGTGSGYQAVVLAELGCKVYSAERLEFLYRRAGELLCELGVNSVSLVLTDGTMGYARCAPYDRVIVTAGGPRIPEPLVEQLDEKGIMLIPVGNPREQRLMRVTRNRGGYDAEDCGPVAFVDLVGNHGW